MEQDREIVVPQQDEVRVWVTAEGDVCISREPHEWETVDGAVIIRVPRGCVQALIGALQGLAKDGNG